MSGRRLAWLGFGGIAVTVGGCQLVSGLSGYKESASTETSTGAGGATTTGTTESGNGGAAGTSSSDATGSGGCQMCTGVCIDTMADPENCGACNKPCEALHRCEAGVCVDSGPYEAVTGISANASAVYWTTTKAGTTRIHVATSPKWRVSPIELSLKNSVPGIAAAADGQSVFFTWNDPSQIGLHRWAPTPAPGGKVSVVSADGSLDTAGALHADANRVMWAGRVPLGPAASGPQWYVYATYPTQAITDPGMATPGSPPFTEDGTYVYWPDGSDVFNQADPPKNPAQFTADLAPDPIAYFAADADDSTSGYLYWITKKNDLYRISKGPDGAALGAEKASTNVGLARGLVVSGSHVYWLQGNCAAGTGTLNRVQGNAGQNTQGTSGMGDATTPRGRATRSSRRVAPTGACPGVAS